MGIPLVWMPCSRGRDMARQDPLEHGTRPGSQVAQFLMVYPEDRPSHAG